MSSSLQAVRPQALQLPPEERAILAQELWDSLCPDTEEPLDIDDGLTAEVLRRSEAAHQGQCVSLDWRQMDDDLRRELEEIRRPS